MKTNLKLLFTFLCQKKRQIFIKWTIMSALKILNFIWKVILRFWFVIEIILSWWSRFTLGIYHLYNLLLSVDEIYEYKISFLWLLYITWQMRRNFIDIIEVPNWDKQKRVFPEWVFKLESRNFPVSPVVKTPRPNAEGIGLIPGWGTKIPHAAWLTKKKKKKTCRHKRNYIVFKNKSKFKK